MLKLCLRFLILIGLRLFHPKKHHCGRHKERWITFTLPGAIELVAVLVRFLASAVKFTSAYTVKAIFLHSPDKELANVGAKNSYDCTRNSLWKMRKDRIKNLFKWWNG